MHSFIEVELAGTTRRELINLRHIVVVVQAHPKADQNQVCLVLAGDSEDEDRHTWIKGTYADLLRRLEAHIDVGLWRLRSAP